MSRRYEVWVEYQDERKQPTGDSFSTLAEAQSAALAVASSGVLGGMGYVMDENYEVVGYFPGGALSLGEWEDCRNLKKQYSQPRDADDTPLSARQWKAMLASIITSTDAAIDLHVVADDDREAIIEWVLETALHAIEDGKADDKCSNALDAAEQLVASSDELMLSIVGEKKPRKKRRRRE